VHERCVGDPACNQAHAEVGYYYKSLILSVAHSLTKSIVYGLDRCIYINNAKSQRLDGGMHCGTQGTNENDH
jgi:hypothetical protein